MFKANALWGAVTAISLAAAPLQAKDAKDVIMPENAEARAFQEAVGFADAVIAGDMVYLSGVVSVPAPDETDLTAAYERSFVRIGKTLARAGVTWDDVVDLTTYHTDLAGQINSFAAVKNNYVKAPFPAWTAIGISTLYEPTGVTEIKIVARKPAG